MFDWFRARGILPNIYSLIDKIALLQTVRLFNKNYIFTLKPSLLALCNYQTNQKTQKWSAVQTRKTLRQKTGCNLGSRYEINKKANLSLLYCDQSFWTDTEKVHHIPNCQFNFFVRSRTRSMTRTFPWMNLVHHGKVWVYDFCLEKDQKRGS